MKTRNVTAILIIAASSGCFAQTSRISPAHSGALNSKTNVAQPALSVTEAVDYWVTTTENELVPAADAMPEDKYSFAPTAGEFSGVRTFGQQVKHLAANNYRMAARITGNTPTREEESENGPDSVTTKPEIMDYLKGSFAALHRAVASINEENMVQTLHLPYRQKTRLQLAIDAVAHSYDHYGQIVEYLRMNGIVPPASRR
jgi:uncharacterized damage-inducible protein DinB